MVIGIQGHFPNMHTHHRLADLIVPPMVQGDDVPLSVFCLINMGIGTNSGI